MFSSENVTNIKIFLWIKLFHSVQSHILCWIRSLNVFIFGLFLKAVLTFRSRSCDCFWLETTTRHCECATHVPCRPSLCVTVWLSRFSLTDRPTFPESSLQKLHILSAVDQQGIQRPVKTRRVQRASYSSSLYAILIFNSEWVSCSHDAEYTNFHWSQRTLRKRAVWPE